MADGLLICVSQHQALLATSADQLDYLLYCLHRWHLEVSTCRSKMHPESVVFQHFYEVGLSVSSVLLIRFSAFLLQIKNSRIKTVGSETVLMWTFPSGLFVSHPVRRRVSFCWTIARLPIPTSQYCGVLLNRARATHRFKRRSWSDEVQNQFVGIPLHPGWNVSTHLC